MTKPKPRPRPKPRAKTRPFMGFQTTKRPVRLPDTARLFAAGAAWSAED